MASIVVKKPCATCHKAGDVFMCHGCRLSFCSTHITAHREELTKDIDNLSQQHDVLQRELIRGNGTHPLLSAIDTWEEESITKIRNAAEAARADIRQLVDRAKSKLEKTLEIMIDELQLSREADDYTEIDLKRWKQQLEDLRNKLEQPPHAGIIEDDETLSIPLIKVGDKRDQQQSRATARSLYTSEISLRSMREPTLLVRERFEDVNGPATLSEDGLMATYSGAWNGDSIIRGVNLYSSGIHHIRFRIKERFYNSPFFGITTAAEEITAWDFEASTINGWSNLDSPVVNGGDKLLGRDRIIRPGDDVSLTLDCGRRQIFFEHHRTKRLLHLPIDLRVCPLPWKIMVILHRRGDCVRITGGSLSLTKENLLAKLSEKPKD